MCAKHLPIYIRIQIDWLMSSFYRFPIFLPSSLLLAVYKINQSICLITPLPPPPPNDFANCKIITMVYINISSILCISCNIVVGSGGLFNIKLDGRVGWAWRKGISKINS